MDQQQWVLFPYLDSRNQLPLMNLTTPGWNDSTKPSSVSSLVRLRPSPPHSISEEPMEGLRPIRLPTPQAELAKPSSLSRASSRTRQPAPSDTTPVQIPGAGAGPRSPTRSTRPFPQIGGAAAVRARDRALPAAACEGRPVAALRARFARPAYTHHI